MAAGGGGAFANIPQFLFQQAATAPRPGGLQGLLGAIQNRLPAIAQKMGPQYMQQQQDRRARLRSLIGNSPGVQQFQGPQLNFRPSPINFTGLLGAFGRGER